MSNYVSDDIEEVASSSNSQSKSISGSTKVKQILSNDAFLFIISIFRNLKQKKSESGTREIIVFIATRM